MTITDPNFAYVALGWFMSGWFTVATYVSVVLHRGLSHRAILMPQWFVHLSTFICCSFGIYVNPRVWVAEHRLHHAHSDTDEDPDKKPGWGLAKFIWWSLANPAGPNDEHVVKISQDKALQTWLMRLYSNPQFGLVCQFVIGFTVPWLLTRDFWAAFFLWGTLRAGGVCVKTIQGYFSHQIENGYRNFETNDCSVNLNGWFSTFMSAGESLQNNHHARPTSATHAFKPGERDFGYALVWLYLKFGVITLPAKSSMTPVAEVETVPA